MTRIKRIKIYTHNKNFFYATGEKAGKSLKSPAKSVFYTAGFLYIIITGFVNFVKYIFNTAFSVCFHTGNALVMSFLKFLKVVRSEINQTASLLPKRIKLISSRQFAKSLIIFIFFAIAGLGLIQSLNLVAKALEMKDRVINSALLGNWHLNQAKDSLVEQNFSEAQNQFTQAFNTFYQAQQDMSEAGQIFNKLLGIFPQKQDADALLSSAGLISQAGQDFIKIQSNFAEIKISPSGISGQEKNIKEIFKDIDFTLKQTENKLSKAASQIEKVNLDNLPENQRENFVSLKSKIQIISLSVGNLEKVFSLANSFLMGQKNILLLFENNNELRASGGFIGTFGNLKLTDGNITAINVSSIYDLDGQLSEIIKPPHPILNVNSRWFMRDANWFADFPATAKAVSGFYEKEGGETPDIVIAITPNLIIDWLKITGPISMPKYGITINADNFIEQTQVATTLNENMPTNEPKQILADLVPIFMQKFSEADKNLWPIIIQSLQNNLNSKQIAVYSRDSTLAQKLNNFHWTGNIEKSDRDYLSIISSNLGGTKTDLFVDQKINLKTMVEQDGSIINELSITRTNKLPVLDKTGNISYLRILVPNGSKLISNLGFDYKNLDFPKDIDYRIDDSVLAWEKNSVKDVLTGTTIGTESGKTFFANWMELKGGESKTIKIIYQLPFKLNSVDRYSLILQKQIGSSDFGFNWNLNFTGRQIAWKNFDPQTLDTNQLVSDILINKDSFFGLVLQKR